MIDSPLLTSDALHARARSLGCVIVYAPRGFRVVGDDGSDVFCLNRRALELCLRRRWLLTPLRYALGLLGRLRVVGPVLVSFLRSLAWDRLAIAAVVLYALSRLHLPAMPVLHLPGVHQVGFIKLH